MHTEKFLAALAAHVTLDEQEEGHRVSMMRFVAARPRDWWKRATIPGHVTGSAWILNQLHTHALLLHHQKLNLWVQPGGHLDDTDVTPAAGALREALEETGNPTLALAGDVLFDVDIHSIPARPARAGKLVAEPVHIHYDARYLITAADHRVTISEESLGARWIRLEELAQPLRDRSIARMAEKSLRLKK
jgi:8-oxo-dGTP pyrophosphatase MutT (NUDIX family)